MNLPKHLADDQLDVLVVDGHALRPIDVLDLFHQVHLEGLDPLHAKLLVGVDRSLGQLLPDLHHVAVGHRQPGPQGDRVLDLVAVVRGDRDAADLLLLVVLDRHHPGELGDLGLALGPPSLEQLLDPRQAVGDVLAGHAARVERPHGQLRAGLPDRLGRDDPHRFADVHERVEGMTQAQIRQHVGVRNEAVRVQETQRRGLHRPAEM